MQISYGDISYTAVNIEQNRVKVDYQLPAANAAAARSSSCSAAKWSIALENTSPWGDMSLEDSTEVSLYRVVRAN